MKRQSRAAGLAAAPRAGATALAAAAADVGRWQRAQRAGRRWAVWGAILGVGIGLLTQAPAQWLADGVRSATDGRLLLADARGSVWNGSAALVLTGGAGSRDASALPGRLTWRLRPAWHGLSLQAQQSCCLPDGLQLRWLPGWAGHTLAIDGPAGTAAPGTAAPASDAPRLLGQWPAAWLAGLGTPWNTLQLGGQLQLAQLSAGGVQLQSSAGRLRLVGDLQLQLRGASSRLSALPTLGSWQLLVQGAAQSGTQSSTASSTASSTPGGTPGGTQAGDATRLRLSTQEGPLQLTGDGLWTGARLRFQGVAQATDGQESALANLLNIIGRRQGALSVISIG